MELLRTRLRIANALRHRLEQCPGHLRMALDDRSKAKDGQLIAPNLGVGPNRGATSGLVDQGHLAERIARAQPSHLVAIHEHNGLAAFDHEECTAALALLGHQVARRVRARVELLRQPTEKLLVGFREERDSANQVAARARPAPPITRQQSFRSKRRVARKWRRRESNPRNIPRDATDFQGASRNATPCMTHAAGPVWFAVAA